jgi:hypothetical protein
VEIKTYAELVSLDERNKLMAFMEARVGGGHDIEIATRVGQEMVSHIDLHADVPDGVIASFERVRKVFSFGIFEYEMFTVARDQAVLLLEQALRERFVSLYDNEVTLVNHQSGEEDRVKVTDFEALWTKLNERRPEATGPWRLMLRSGDLMMRRDGRPVVFRGGLTQLQEWARQEKLLDGQRTRSLDSYLVADRNRVAHALFHLTMPVDGARTIYDMAETINRLWGHSTPGGRLYPTPIKRTTVIVAWADGGNNLTMMRPDQLPYFDPPDDWTLIIVLGRENDESLMGFDARYERTAAPAEWLWGPGDKTEAAAWIEEHGIQTDVCTTIDRLLVVQAVDGKTYLPRRPEVALGLTVDRRRGSWHLLLADRSLDAFNRIRNNGMAVEEVFSGSWGDMAEILLAKGIAAIEVPQVWVPGFRSRVAPDVGAD